MNLADITPMILTFNEQLNLRATLTALEWADQILIVDSGSTDATMSIASEFPRVKVLFREFDHFADQCNYGLTNVTTKWTLSLDADYVCSQQFIREIAQVEGLSAGYISRFVYCIYGMPLRSTIYPPRTVLYQTDRAHYHRDGHAHRVAIDGDLAWLKTPLRHDDYKPIDVWFRAQWKYAELEATKILATEVDQLHWKDRLRRLVVVAPCLTLIYCLVVKRLILDGWPGVFYSLQRVLAELLLSLTLLDRRIRSRNSSNSQTHR